MLDVIPHLSNSASFFTNCVPDCQPFEATGFLVDTSPLTTLYKDHLSNSLGSQNVAENLLAALPHNIYFFIDNHIKYTKHANYLTISALSKWHPLRPISKILRNAPSIKI